LRVWVLRDPGSTSRRTAAPPTNATLDRTFILFQRFPREVSGDEVLTKRTPEAAAHKKSFLELLESANEGTKRAAWDDVPDLLRLGVISKEDLASSRP